MTRFRLLLLDMIAPSGPPIFLVRTIMLLTFVLIVVAAFRH
jgi:hypothetical protein